MLSSSFEQTGRVEREEIFFPYQEHIPDEKGMVVGEAVLTLTVKSPRTRKLYINDLGFRRMLREKLYGNVIGDALQLSEAIDRLDIPEMQKRELQENYLTPLLQAGINLE